MPQPTANLQPQSAQGDAPPERDVREGIVLSRLDGKKDVVPVEFPSVPVRLAIVGTFRYAAGWREGDEDEPSGETNEGDLAAVCWAALGVCWRGKEVGLPAFRDMGRDVVAYGEAVMSQLLFAGYGPVRDQTSEGLALLQAFREEVNAAVRRAEAGFPKAKGHR